MFLEECKYIVKEKKMHECVTDGIEISSESDRKYSDEENFNEENPNEENSNEDNLV